MNNGDSSPCVLFALDRECAPFRRLFPHQERCRAAPCRAWRCSKAALSLLIMEIGVGPEKTRTALDWLLGSRAKLLPAFVVMAGFAGSLEDGLRVGDVLLASEIVDLSGRRWPATWPTSKKGLAVNIGPLLTTPRLVGDPAEKRRWHETFGARAVDMEAAAIAPICADRGIPFGCVRSISDNVETQLSEHLVAPLSNGQVSMPRLLATLMRHPSLLGSLLRLARATKLAARRLAEELAALLEAASEV